MELKNNKYEELLKNQLFPINFKEECENKRLSLSLNLFKICRNFPREEIGKMKQLQKNQEKEILSQEIFGESFEKISEHQYESLKRLLNERSQTPLKNSAYIKFIIKSFVKTFIPNSKIASFREESEENWVLDLNGIKYDISTNPEKFSTSSLIVFEGKFFLDENKMIKKDVIFYLADFFKINAVEVSEVNESINKVINNFNKLYNKVVEIDLKKQILEKDFK